VKKPVYTPRTPGARLTIVCFVSGSGTNYQRIVEAGPDHHYFVFTNRPGCQGAEKARANGHTVIELSHIPFLKEARARYAPAATPRNCPEREKYEKCVWSLIEGRIQRKPDLVWLAGYDQWVTDWTVARYYPRMLNIHPGDTTLGYAGLHWVPTARAILAGDRQIRSTVFFVDMGEDTGPVLAQSSPLDITATLAAEGLTQSLLEVTNFAGSRALTTWEGWESCAGAELKAKMKTVCQTLQEALKVAGDWQIYPLAVHGLIAPGRVEVEDRTVIIDGRPMPAHGYRPDEV
jgi:folate-dependent phosphoribosylglycinamide formyltransferase PurN